MAVDHLYCDSLRVERTRRSFQRVMEGLSYKLKCVSLRLKKGKVSKTVFLRRIERAKRFARTPVRTRPAIRPLTLFVVGRSETRSGRKRGQAPPLHCSLDSPEFVSLSYGCFLEGRLSPSVNDDRVTTKDKQEVPLVAVPLLLPRALQPHDVSIAAGRIRTPPRLKFVIAREPLGADTEAVELSIERRDFCQQLSLKLQSPRP